MDGGIWKGRTFQERMCRMSKMLHEYCFTFGFGQEHEGGYHIVKADNAMEARKEMCRKFGRKWAMMYNSKEDAGVDEYGLHEVK
jgi:hypothetical protein